MEYVVLPIEGAAQPRFRESPDLNTVVDEIEQVYRAAARDGGRVIAGHTLTCDWASPGPDGEPVPTRIDYLFLVVERPRTQ